MEFLANSAEREIQQTPLQQFLASLEIINENGELPKHYYGLNAKQQLVLYWSGIWDVYSNYNKGREYASQDAVRQEIEALDINGKATTHSYKAEASPRPGKKEVRHGYCIPPDHLSPIWLRAFGKRIAANKKELEQANNPKTEPIYTTHDSTAPF